MKASTRKHLTSSQFGLPSQRKYPINDRAHAADAKSRAVEMYHEGKLSKSQEQEIISRADKVLGKTKP